jgi:hypothetical protein
LVKRRLVRRAAVAVLAALALAPAASAADSLAVRASVSPRSHLFGDAVVAEVEVVVDRGAADSVRVRPNFAPYRAIAPPVARRLDGGSSVELHYRYTLDCLVRACLPGDTRRRVVFSPVHVLARIAGRQRDAVATWPALTVRSRLAPEDVSRPQLRSSVYPIGAVSYRVGPGGLFWTLVAVASLFAMGAAVLLVHVLRGLRIPWRRSRFERLGSLERAIYLVRLSADADDSGRRRRALERLGHELELRGRTELGQEACRLAWSGSAPEEGDVLSLAGRIEAELGRAS